MNTESKAVTAKYVQTDIDPMLGDVVEQKSYTNINPENSPKTVKLQDSIPPQEENGLPPLPTEPPPVQQKQETSQVQQPPVEEPTKVPEFGFDKSPEQVAPETNLDAAKISADFLINSYNSLALPLIKGSLKTDTSELKIVFSHNNLEDGLIKMAVNFFTKTDEEIAEILKITKEEAAALRPALIEVFKRYGTFGTSHPLVQLAIILFGIGINKYTLIQEAKKQRNEALKELINSINLNLELPKGMLKRKSLIAQLIRNKRAMINEPEEIQKPKTNQTEN